MDNMHTWIEADAVADFFAANLSGTDDAAVAVAAERMAVQFSLTPNFAVDDVDARFRSLNFDTLMEVLRERVESGEIVPGLEVAEPRRDTGREARYANHPFYSAAAMAEVAGRDAAVAVFGEEAVAEALGEPDAEPDAEPEPEPEPGQ